MGHPENGNAPNKKSQERTKSSSLCFFLVLIYFFFSSQRCMGKAIFVLKTTFQQAE